MRRRLIAGNWKMNGLRADGRALAEAVVAKAGGAAAKSDLLLCPPATLLADVAAIVRASDVALGAQDCSAEAGGAFTGEVSAEMVADLGCGFAILGHSERRRLHGEDDAIVARKAARAQAAGLNAIVCVGETADQRDRGLARETVGAQLHGSLPEDCDPGALLLAYEPLWAIGTGRTPSARDIERVHGFLRERLIERFSDAGAAVRLLYGGSVRPGNAGKLLSADHVDGALVGGASLDADDFIAIALASAGNPPGHCDP